MKIAFFGKKFDVHYFDKVKIFSQNIQNFSVVFWLSCVLTKNSKFSMITLS